VLLEAVDLDGNDIRIEADELLARLFQHELDHLNGVLMFDRMTDDQRKQALVEYRKLADGDLPRGETRHIGLK
jgi:peptide deformylase